MRRCLSRYLLLLISLNCFYNLSYGQCPSIGGSVKGGGTVCVGQTPPLLRLEGKDGNVIRWEQSTNNGQSWTQIANTSINYQPGNLTTTTFFRAVVRKGVCAPARSLEARLVVNQNTAVGGTVSSNQNICSGNTPSALTLSGQTGTIVRWESSTDSTNWTSISNTTTTLQPPVLRATTWYRAVLAGVSGCAEVFATPAKIAVQGSGSPGEVNELSQNGCENRNSGTLNLTNFEGVVLRWETSTDQITWTTIENTTTRQTYENLPLGETYYRAVVQQPGCEARYSEIGVVIISAASVGGTTTNDVPDSDDGNPIICNGPDQWKPKITLAEELGTILRWEYFPGEDPEDWPKDDTQDPPKEISSNQFLSTNARVLNLLDSNIVIAPNDPATFRNTSTGRRLLQSILVRAVVKNGNCEEAFSSITVIKIGVDCCTNPVIKPQVPELVYENEAGEESTDNKELWKTLGLKLDFKVGSGEGPDGEDNDHTIHVRKKGTADFVSKDLNPDDKPWFIGAITFEDPDMSEVEIFDNEGYEIFITKKCSLTVVPASKLISDTVTCWICTRVNPERLTVDGVTDSSARISWFDQSSGSKYIVKWRVRNPNPNPNDTAWFVSEILDRTQWEIPNLAPQSQYEVQVIKYCFDGTDWVETSAFSRTRVKDRTYNTKDFTTTGTAPACANFDVFNWAKSAGSATGNEIGRAVTTDKDGFIYATGAFKGTVQVGSFTLVSANAARYDNYIAKYDMDGTPLWVKRMGSGSSAEFSESGNGVVADMNGNVYATGRFYGSAAFGNTIITSNGDADIYVAKFRVTDGTLLWAKRAGGQYADAGLGLALDQLGNLIVSGKITGNAKFGSTTISGNTSNSDAFIAAFKQADGAFNWVRRAGNVDTDDAAHNVVVDKENNIYFSGYVGGSPRNPLVSFGNISVSNNTDVIHGFVARYNSLGEAEWVKTIDKDYSVINGISVDAQNNIVTCGWFQGTIDFGGIDRTSANKTSGPNPSIDMFVAKYSGKSGREIFIIAANDVSNTGDEYARGLVTDKRGDIYVTGHFDSPVLKVGSKTLNNFSGGFSRSDFFVAKLSGNGSIVQAINGGSDTNDDGAYGISLDKNGIAYIVGDYKDKGLFPTVGGQTDTLTSNAGTWDAFLAQVSCDDPIKCDYTPRNIFVSNIDNNTVSVNWFNEGPAVKTYDIRYRSLNSQMWTVKTGITAPPYIIGNLFAGQRYEVQVRANCSDAPGGNPQQTGPSLYSDPIPFETIGVGSCPTPTGLANYNIYYTEAFMVWDKVPGAAYYEVSYRKLATEDWITVRADSNGIMLTGLQENTRYEIRVRSRCTDRLSSPFSNTARISTLTGDCPLPNNVTASMITPNSAVVTWSISVGAIEYNVQWRKMGTSTWSVANTVENSYKINFLENNTEYEYRVQAVCGSTTNTSSYTNTQIFMTSPACQAPTGTQVLDVTKNTITLGWDAMPGGMVYYVEYKPTTALGFQIDSSYTNQITLENLEPGVRYDIRLRTNCGNDNLTEYTQIINATTITFCEAPQALSAVNITANSMQVQWVGPTDAVGYKLEYKKTSDLEFNEAIVIATNVYQLENLSSDTEYTIRVVSICKDGTTSDFTSSVFKTQPCNPPANFRADKISPTEVVLKWSAVPGAVNYSLFYRDENGNDFTETVEGTSFTIQGLSEGRKYFAYISVDCGEGTVAATDEIEFTTAQTCQAPVNLTCVGDNITSNAVPISWTEVPGATGYVVYWKRNDDIDPVKSTQLLPTNAFVVTPLTPNTEYKIWVETRCGTQTSESSEPTICTTKDSGVGCFTPTIIIPISVFRTFATINWTFVPEAINYTVSWRRFGQPQWTSTTINDPNTTNFTISNLFSGSTYQVRVRARCPFGFTDWSEASFTTLTGKGEGDFADANWTIYPNPNNGQFNVNFTSEELGTANIQLFDMTGRLVFEQSHQVNTGINTIDVATNGTIATGVYSLKFILNGKTQVTRISITD